MRVRALLVLTLASLGAPVLALEPQDTLRDWKMASGTDRDRVLKQLDASMGGSASRKDVLSCLDGAAGIAPHADLRIADIFKACAKQSSEKAI
jgi:hypothetical protein